MSVAGITLSYVWSVNVNFTPKVAKWLKDTKYTVWKCTRTKSVQTTIFTGFSPLTFH